MRFISKAGVAGLATAGLVAAGAGAAFAAPPPASGVVNGTVTVATALTLEITSGANFTIAGAQPGVPYNGVPPTDVKVLTNDSGGYALTTYLNDPNPQTGDPACIVDAFNDGAGGTSNPNIPDNAWTDTSTGPGAPNGPQTYPMYANGALANGQGGCINPTPQAIPVGSNAGQSAANGDAFTETVAVDVPANTPGGVTFTGSLTYLATGN